MVKKKQSNGWDSRERRQFVRVKFPCEITVGSPSEHSLPAKADNISAGGVRVLISEKLEISSLVGLDIYGIKKEPITCKGRVRWVFTRKIPYHKGLYMYDTGLEFYQIKERDIREIKRLVASLVAAKPF